MMKQLTKLSILMVLALSLVGCVNNEGVPIETTETTVTEPVVEVPKEKEVVQAFGGELRVSMRNPKTLNPLTNLDPSVDRTLKLVYESLFIMDENGQPRPNLVSEYTFSDDFSNITLSLKESVLFHNGEALLSKDVAYSIKLLKNPEIPSLYSNTVSNIQRYSIIDDKNIKIYFKQPYAFALYDLTFPIVNAAHMAKGEEVIYEPIGTGPYAFTSFASMKELKLTYYNDYREKYWIKDINCIITRDEAAENNAFKQNLIDLVTPAKFNWQQYYEDEATNMYEYTTNYYEFVGFNFNHELLKLKDVRHAFANGINREEILAKLYLSHGELTNSIIRPNSYLKANNNMIYSYDIEAAKATFNKYVKEDQGLSFRLLVNSDNAIRMAEAEMIKEDMAEVGVTINIDTASKTDFLTKLQNKEYDLVLTAVKLGYKPDFTDLLHGESVDVEGGNNFISYKNEYMNALLESIYKAPTEKQLMSKIEEFDEYFTEEIPYLSLFFLNSIVLTNDDIYGDLNVMRDNKQIQIKDIYISR